MRSKVEGHPDLVRDVNGVIINSNKEAFLNHVNARKVHAKRDERLESLELELANLKRLVKQLTTKVKSNAN